jgi:heme oxygenase (mycobilin-producing)
MTVIRMGELKAKSGKSDALLEFIGRVIVPGVKTSRGCVTCQVMRHLDDPNRFFILETWDSIESHKASAKNISREEIAEIMPLLDDSPQGGYYEELVF